MPVRPQSAGEALLAAGLDVAAVRGRLPHVEPFAVPVRAASPWFRRFWAHGIVAVAMPWAIYVTDAALARLQTGAEPERSGSLIVHELVHLEQYARLGARRHLTQYVADYVGARIRGASHWDAYRGVRLEVEARDLAADLVAGIEPR